MTATRSKRWTHLIGVACPYCSAEPGERCKNLVSPDEPAQFPHAARGWMLHSPDKPMPGYVMRGRPRRPRAAKPTPPSSLPDADYALLLFLRTFPIQHYRTPSLDEIAEARGMTKDEAFRRLEALVQQGIS